MCLANGPFLDFNFLKLMSSTDNLEDHFRRQFDEATWERITVSNIIDNPESDDLVLSIQESREMVRVPEEMIEEVDSLLGDRVSLKGATIDLKYDADGNLQRVDHPDPERDVVEPLPPADSVEERFDRLRAAFDAQGMDGDSVVDTLLEPGRERGSR